MRLAGVLLAALVLSGCLGGDDSVARYERACADLPALQDLGDPRRSQAVDAELAAALKRVAALTGQSEFEDALERIGDARAALREAIQTFRTSGDPTDTTGNDGYLPVDRAATNLATRYQEAFVAARDAGIDCPGLESGEPIASPDEPHEVSIAAPAGLSADELARFERGRRVLAQSGCLACHQVGGNGGDLGPDLTAIGSRLSRTQLARVLVDPVSPMPSFRGLPERKRADLVAFMVNLRG